MMVTHLKSKRKCVAAVKAAGTEGFLKNKLFEQMENITKKNQITHKKGTSAFLLICRHTHTQIQGQPEWSRHAAQLIDLT